MPEQKKMVNSGELAKIIGRTDRTIQLLAKDGILTCEKNRNKNQYDLYVAVQEYIDYLTKTTSEKISSNGDAKLREEIRYKRAKADMMELELMEIEGQMHRAEDVKAVMTDMVLAIRSALLSLPGRLGVSLAAISSAAECSNAVKKEVCELLEDLSKYQYDREEYRKRVRERQGWKEMMMEDEQGG